MGTDHYRTLSAVFPILLRGSGDGASILLHRRANTGYMDGKWDMAGSGHVDEGETARMAVVRECREELGIVARTEDAQFAYLAHRFSPDRTYYDIYFAIRGYEGTPTIMEPEKCSEMRWFPLDGLPEDMIGCRKEALRDYLQGLSYGEHIEREIEKDPSLRSG